MIDGIKEDLHALTLGLEKAGRGVWNVVRAVLLYVLGTVALAALSYAVFALVFNTDAERRLRRENRMYEKNWELLSSREQMLSGTVEGLQYKDADIYGQVFHADPPALDPMSSLDRFYASDTIPRAELTGYVAAKADSLLAKAGKVDAAFGKILRTIAVEDFPLPPMQMPVKGLTYPQVGASVGEKINPFYKAWVYHCGVDFIMPRDTPVYATADGVVGQGTGTFRTLGNIVAIDHGRGYVTRYAHLDDVCVLKGEKVRRGQKIGTVGMTGASYAPHLHYEVLRNGDTLDPMGFVFASVSPDEYANMLYMSAHTMQSMD